MIHNYETWIDLGDWGQIKVQILATLGRFPTVQSVKSGETELVSMMPREWESMILEEIRDEEDSKYEDDCTDARNDQRLLEKV